MSSRRRPAPPWTSLCSLLYRARPGRRVARWLAASALLGAGCASAEPATEVLIVVDSDLHVGSELTRVQAKVLDATGSDEVLGSADFVLAARAGERGYTLPLSFSLAPQREASTRRFRLQVEGYGRRRPSDPESRVVERQVIGAFRPHRALRIEVFLGRICLGVVCSEVDGQPLTCGDDGQCGAVPLAQDPEPVPGLDASTELVVTDDAGAAAEDAASEDSGADTADASAAQGDGGTLEDGGGPSPEPDGGGVADAGCTSSSCCPAGTLPTSEGCIPDPNECADPGVCPAAWPCAQTLPAGYTCLGELADWPIPDELARSRRPSYSIVVDGAPGLVRDQVTGLYWERTIDGNAQLSYAAAVARCDGLSIGAWSDFRVPSRAELSSLLDHSHAAPYMDTTAFPGALAGLFWTRDPQDSGVRWGMHFGDFGPAGYGETGTLYVRCVRSDPLPPGTPRDRYAVDPTSDRVTDRRTGLVWQRTADTALRSFTDASAICQRLGMSLPSLRELLSLVDAGRRTPALAPDVFPTPGRNAMWTRTPVPSASSPGALGAVYAVSFEDGGYFSAPLAASSGSLTYAYRCVQ
jgi:Protein of unknown function (DUF1566)